MMRSRDVQRAVTARIANATHACWRETRVYGGEKHWANQSSLRMRDLFQKPLFEPDARFGCPNIANRTAEVRAFARGRVVPMDLYFYETGSSLSRASRSDG
jgi:hypothetical protein